jgi:hypothetical protein
VNKWKTEGVEMMIINDIHERLTNELLRVNETLPYSQAKTWVELLWEDFETTRAKAGHQFKGAEMTEKIVRNWIINYGPRLHEFVTENPKYKDLLNSDDRLLH